MSSKAALKAAIASSVSGGLAKEIIEVGKTGKMPPMKSLMGLGMYDGAYDQALVSLGWSISGTVKSIGSGIKRGVTATGSGIKRATLATGSGIKRATTWTGSKIASGAKTAYRWGGKVLNKVKGLWCTVAASPLSDAAIGAAAASYGVPPQAGVAGKQMVQGAVCPPGTKPIPEALITEDGLVVGGGGMPGWVLPVGIGAAGLVAVLLLTKK